MLAAFILVSLAVLLFEANKRGLVQDDSLQSLANAATISALIGSVVALAWQSQDRSVRLDSISTAQHKATSITSSTVESHRSSSSIASATHNSLVTATHSERTTVIGTATKTPSQSHPTMVALVSHPIVATKRSRAGVGTWVVDAWDETPVLLMVDNQSEVIRIPLSKMTRSEFGDDVSWEWEKGVDWHPIESRIAFVSSRFDILEYSTSETMRVIVDSRTDVIQRDPRYSFDGSRLAYISTLTGQSELYVIDLRIKGARPKRITGSTGYEPIHAYSWAPNKNAIAYVTEGLRLSTVTLEDQLEDQSAEVDSFRGSLGLGLVSWDPRGDLLASNVYYQQINLYDAWSRSKLDCVIPSAISSDTTFKQFDWSNEGESLLIVHNTGVAEIIGIESCETKGTVRVPSAVIESAAWSSVNEEVFVLSKGDDDFSLQYSNQDTDWIVTLYEGITQASVLQHVPAQFFEPR